MKKALLTRPVAFRISPQEYKIIKEISDKKEISMNEFVRELINKEAKQREMNTELAI